MVFAAGTFSRESPLGSTHHRQTKIGTIKKDGSHHSNDRSDSMPCIKWNHRIGAQPRSDPAGHPNEPLQHDVGIPWEYFCGVSGASDRHKEIYKGVDHKAVENYHLADLAVG